MLLFGRLLLRMLRVWSGLLLARGLGVLLVVIAGILLLVVLLRLLLFFLVGFRRTDGLPLILLFGSYLIAVGGVVELRNLFNVHPFGLLLGCLLLIKGRGSKSVEVQRVWEIYDERPQFMSRQDALQLDESLDAGDVSRAWLVRSGVVEAALADAFRFSGGPLPSRFLVLGRSSASFRIVRLGGRKVRKARGNAADSQDAADVFLYRDSSIAPLLDMRRRFKAVMDVLDAMIRNGISLSRSVELTAQWDRVLAIGPLYPVTLGDLDAVRGLGIGAFHHAVSDIHRRLCDFIHAVVVHRRVQAIRGWRNWIREDPMVHPHRWLRPDVVPPAPFLQCEPQLAPGGSGVLADPARIDVELRKA